MQYGFANRARRMGAACALISATSILGACDLRKELLAPQTPGTIDEAAASGPTGANGLRVGALGALKLQTGSGETLWQLGGLLTDEWKSSNAAAATNEIDARAVSGSNASLTAAYNNIQQSRGYFRDAISAMNQYIPANTSQIGELYFGLAFVEMQMAEDLCNGIPLGSVDGTTLHYGTPVSNAAVFALASAHLDSAIALAAGTDTASIRIRTAALVAKGRVLIDLGQFSAATAVTASVPTAYQYVLTFTAGSGLNGNWNLNTNQVAYTLGDSTDAAGVTKNSLPFASAKDVRVPSTNPNKKGLDGSTSIIAQSIWANTGQIPLVSGIDARLVDAEAKLNANDVAGMMTILNALRTTVQTMGTFKPTAMTALAIPATQTAAVATFFREKAFWTFGRGQRLGDLRRMVRQYSVPAASAFPTGAFFKGGSYGSDVNFPVPDAERVNPAFTGCIDRNP